MTQSTLDQKEMRYRRIAITIVMMGVMMSAVDTTAVVLALPVIIVDLDSNIITMVWVLLAYLLVDRHPGYPGRKARGYVRAGTDVQHWVRCVHSSVLYFAA